MTSQPSSDDQTTVKRHMVIYYLAGNERANRFGLRMTMKKNTQFGQLSSEVTKNHSFSGLGETFSGPETMDLEHDRLGFLVIFSKIAKFIEL